MSRPYGSPAVATSGGGGGSLRGQPRLRVAKSPNEAMARTNCVFVNPRDIDPNARFVLLEDNYAFNVRTSDAVPPGEIFTTLFHRRFGSLSLNQEVSVWPFDPAQENPNCFMGTIDLQVGFLKRNFETAELFNVQEMEQIFRASFDGQIFAVGQTVNFDFHGTDLLCEVVGITPVDFEQIAGSGAGQMGVASTASGTQQGAGAAARLSRGIFLNQTIIHFVKASDSAIKLKGEKKSAAPNALLQPNFSFEDLGIGGLDHEFSQIFRRAFASRIFPPSIVEKLGIQHVKGILLYGPPGTGKTLMARQIGKMLNAREPQIVNGPEILNKYVGQSEENVRKLFAAAEQEYKAKGEESGLHIIIFDELDAICKQRGSKNDGTGVGDSIVNQLLSKMDGVEQLNNILIIGMTNRLDMIDEALIRPGRLEIHMEINLPDEKGRLQILNVHTARMRTHELLEHDVSLQELAERTKNFSGAEIAGLIKSASSFSFNRHIKIGASVAVDQDYESMKVAREDFMLALEEVHPSFGVAEMELQQCVANGVIKYAPHIERILSDGQLFIEQVRRSKRTPLVSVLIHGPSGAGKTALAATIAMASDFPFIKLISPESMVGFTEQAKMNHISKIFNDAHRSEFSCIVIDSIERVLDWVAIGPRFSNTVLQTLMVLLKKPPMKNHRLLILATTNQRHVLSQMDLTEAFAASLYTPHISTLPAIDTVLRELATFSDTDRRRAIDALRNADVEARGLAIGVKKLLMVTEMAAQDREDPVEKFVNSVLDEGTSGGGGGREGGREAISIA
ncbi:P-loop containing nucleoside triphosphate hydrolase protein [Fimicolochytrium jonesii]|uniref:P-loop containing nucleoside triphosphate hydrolase protein n=1 Tax=Fimicolochytrium jonesii TaxID=1396493 RepID=UPI0022FEF3FA|nr:P-loop containing nucleoside triphosphate hydrolase protein [Fimicolochytrium jonesii]KAI8826177.1 P-loop containing nucleoside triphosphate hydrolase protein [Fimicolochytrium jonesii]